MNYYTDAFPGRKVTVGDKTYLYFGGTSYLGLQTNPRFQDLYIQNVRKYGTNYGASRKSNIKLSVFEKTEATLAAMVGSEASTTLSSGYLAGQLLAQHFNTEKFKCFYAPNAHSALFQKDTVPFENFKELLRSLKEFKNLNHPKVPVVFIDSIDTIEASYPNFKGLHNLPMSQVILVVDDSHGIGVLGENGSGAYRIIKKIMPMEMVVCCSLGKGFGIQAGAVFGTRARIDQLMNTKLFGGASPAAPAALATFSEAYAIYKEQRSLLKVNLELFLNKTQVIDQFRFIQEHPTFAFENPVLAEYLEEHGILITNFKYPNDKGIVMSRIVISAAHIEEDIEFLAELLNSFK